MTRPKSSAAVFAAAAAKAKEPHYELILFIAGTTPLSARALANVVAICEERLAGRFDLSVIDVYQEPQRAVESQIVAIPTLLKKKPAPLRRLIGDLSDREAVLRGLELPQAKDHGKAR